MDTLLCQAESRVSVSLERPSHGMCTGVRIKRLVKLTLARLGKFVRNLGPKLAK